MEQYIDKNRVEEILRNLWKKNDGYNAEHRICYNKALQEVQCKLDTLEVKEVDVEKESELIANSIMISVQANLYHTNVYDYEKRCYKHSDLKDAARKGIELGFKAQKRE